MPATLDTIIGYSGSDYGVPHDGVFEAIHLVAKTEGIILDPNYTGKSMSALIGEIRAGRLAPDVPVVFVHSGGMPQTFAFAQELWALVGRALFFSGRASPHRPVPSLVTPS